MTPASRALLGLVLALASALPAPASANHVEVNDATFPHGACERTCIPAIVRPRFDEPPYLSEDDPVIGVEVNGDARAYPVHVLVWHEIVNDVVGGRPVAITYCPLCGSAVVFDRDAGRLLTFQTSGRLYRNDLVMLDDETGSLWPQLLGEAVSGPLHGTKLGGPPSQVAPWAAWREAHPATKLLARPLCTDWPHAVQGCPAASPTLARDYAENPYGDYGVSRRVGIFGEEREDVGGLHPKAQVVGIVSQGQAKAWSTDAVVDAGVVTDDVAGRPVVLAARGGAVQVFDRGAAQQFTKLNATHLRDADGAAWDAATGQGPGDRRLAPVPAVTTFWFAWLDFHPDTLLWNGTGTIEVHAPPRPAAPASTPGPALGAVVVLVVLAGLVVAAWRARPR